MRHAQLKMDIETMPKLITADKNCPRLQYRRKSNSKARFAYCRLRDSFQFDCDLCQGAV